eukprot:CAMPEP_0176494678 /NCGR_PEP_ID=MMETSP0200_2-20121128/10238_1 /TAXON_ID=947934 /ORGANISM="Chaetoceros sp., Strain GSL56" /LENGTH=576 /DNA_ID=CAMNT_0017892479 /DNA_START=99 /DNA_END=1826 /DNA_ORIENTATION=-
MSLPPSSHPSSDPNLQPGTSIARWWQENHDKISEYHASAPAPTPFVPPSSITIPVTIPSIVATAPNNNTSSFPAPPSTCSSTHLIDLLSNDDVASTVPPQAPTFPTTAPHMQYPNGFAYPFYTSTTYTGMEPPSANQWASATSTAYPTNHNMINNILHQHSNIISNMTATLNMLQGNQDSMHDQLVAIMGSLKVTQSTLNHFVKNQSTTGPPSLATSSNTSSNNNSNTQSLSSDLSYTQEQHNLLHSTTSISLATKHQATTMDTPHADKKLFPQKYTYDPNNRIAASRWYQDIQSLLSASNYYNTLLLPDGTINLDTGATLPNHNLYIILYRCIDEKFQKVAHSSQWSQGTDILRFVQNTFADNTSFLDDAREAHSTLANICWNPQKDKLMDFAATVSDLYAKLKNTEYEKIVTPTELRHIWWIMALPINIFSAIRGKNTTNDHLPLHWESATALYSLIEATRKEISSQKAHTILANMKKKGPPNPNDTPSDAPSKNCHESSSKTPPPNKSNNGDNQRHPYQQDITSPFQMMRTIEEDIFQGLPIEDLHKKYLITQDSNTCILCRDRSNQKRYHHT